MLQTLNTSYQPLITDTAQWEGLDQTVQALYLTSIRSEQSTDIINSLLLIHVEKHTKTYTVTCKTPILEERF